MCRPHYTFLPVKASRSSLNPSHELKCFLAFQVGMTKTDAAVQTLSDINPDVVLEVRNF